MSQRSIGIVAAGLFCLAAVRSGAEDACGAGEAAWTVGVPIVTYFAGPQMSDAVAEQMAAGGFNVVWCGEQDLDLVHRHGLRGMLHHGLLSPATLELPEKRRELDELVDRVRRHPALYSYYLTDEPHAAAFPALGKLVAYLRERDPLHVAYINLFPTYASNDQLGNRGDVATAYREHLAQYVQHVRPQLISYDHYQFFEPSVHPHNRGDSQQYFLNLRLVREASQAAGVPFLNIVQACSWAPGHVRVPGPQELRYLVYTTLAYGAQGISYYVYSATGHEGGMRAADGTPTSLYHAAAPLNREFVAIATELQPLRSLAVYHTAMQEPGCEPLSHEAPFRLQHTAGIDERRGLLLGCFGRADAASHVLVVNLDYRAEATATLLAGADLEAFDATTRQWSATGGAAAPLQLPPGGGQLLRLVPSAQ